MDKNFLRIIRNNIIKFRIYLLIIIGHGENFPSINKVKDDLSSEIIFSYADKGFVRKKPKTIELSIHKNFLSQIKLNIKKKNMYCFENVKIVGENGTLINKDNLIIDGDFKYIPENNIDHIFTKNDFGKLNEKSIGVFIYPTDNYFHWLIEAIPRINMISKSKVKFDYVIVSQNKKFQIDSIKKTFSNKKIIKLETNTNIKFEKLFVPSMPAYSGNPTKENIEYIRSKFGSNKNTGEFKRIYIKRGKSKNGRIVLNEDEIINFLSLYGFKAIAMDDLSITEQANIFNSANIIVSPHGAALTNLVFCKPKTKVIEFFNYKYVNVCYWAISNCINLDYYYFLTNGNNQNYFVDLRKLESSLNLAKVVL